MTWGAGDVVVYRYGRSGRATFVRTARVVADDADGLLLWVAGGSPAVVTELVDGRGLRAVEPAARWTAPRRRRLTTWQGNGVLMLVPPGRAWSLWWFFADDGRFIGWYGNLEAPAVRWQEGSIRAVDSADRALDVVIDRDRACRWKDEDEFAALTGLPGFWTREQAASIRRDGQDIMDLAASGKPPFDGRWTDYRPDPDWAVVESLPDGWDRPHRAQP